MVLVANVVCLFITCFIDLMYVLDLVMAFVRGVEDYSNHVVHLDRRTIARNYWRKRLLMDSMSVFPWTLAIFMGYPLHEACFNLLKVVRFPSVCRALHLLLISKVRLWYVAMKKAFIVLVPILTIHWLACLSLVFSTGCQGVDRTLWSPTSWLHKLCLGSGTTSDVYWRSTFRVMSTLMFVKVHNLLTPEDIVVEILSTVAGAVLFIFLTLQGFILLRMYRGASLQVEGKVAQLEEFMKYTDLPDQQRDRLLEYFKYCFRKFYFREYQILAFISEHLRE
ncbi:potassium/sodium hyperpolarization-activated cyclic nucleotide-gated channel 1-like, partial [Gryllus bimaculatus]